jgi:autotransporter family porin
MIDVTAITAQATNAFNNRAIYNNGSSPTMQNVTAVARNATTLNIAVFNDAGSSPTLTNVIATASGGATATGIQASNNSAATIQGGIITVSSATTLYGLYSSNTSPVTLTDGQVMVSGGGGGFGVFASTSPLTITQTIIDVTDNSSSNRGLQVQTTSALLKGVSISAHATTDNRAIQVQDASLAMHNSAIEAVNGSSNLGVFNTASGGSYTVTIHNSQITAVSPLLNDAEFTTYIGATYLNGNAVAPGGGTVTCAGVYDEAFVFYASSCP